MPPLNNTGQQREQRKTAIILVQNELEGTLQLQMLCE